MTIWDQIKKTVADVGSLEVLTFTGDVKGVISNDGNMIDWTGMIQKAKAEGEVRLVAATKVEFDRDTRIFIATAADPNMVDAHNKAVESAMTVRQSITGLIIGKVKGA